MCSNYKLRCLKNSLEPANIALQKHCKREIVGYSIRTIRGFNNTSIAFIFFFRKPPAGHEKDRYSLSITVNGVPLGGGHAHTYCWGICKFWVSFSLLYHDSNLQQVCCKNQADIRMCSHRSLRLDDNKSAASCQQA